MNAVAPITIRPVERPRFDNAQLGDFKRWVQANTGLLARYWRDQGQAIGLGANDHEELDLWLKVQHDIEVSDQRRARLPHGDSF